MPHLRQFQRFQVFRERGQAVASREPAQVPPLQADPQPGPGVPGERLQGVARERRPLALRLRRRLLLDDKTPGGQ